MSTGVAVMKAPTIPVVAEADLVIQARQGDRDASNELARRYRGSAYAFALQLLGNREDALDVAQDAMMRFFSTLERFDPERAVQPWLFRIVRNRAYDLRRHRRVRPEQSLDELSEHGAPDPPAGAEHPSLGIERQELRQRIWKALRAMSEDQREILVLRDYQDLSYAEIAEVLKIPKGTVMSRLHRARRSLREILLRERALPGMEEDPGEVDVQER